MSYKELFAEYKRLVALVEPLKSMLEELSKQRAEKDKTLAEKDKALAEKDAKISQLTQQLDWLKRQVYGRKSDKFDHPELFDPEDLGKSPASDLVGEPEAEPQAPAPHRRKKRRIRDAKLPENLPRVIDEVIPDYVKAQPDEWREAGYEETVELEKEPGWFYLRVTRRKKYVRLDNPYSPPVIEPARPRIIENGFWGTSLLAEILINRFLYHLPYTRQQQMYSNRFKVDLSPNTMSDNAGKIAEQCAILMRRMKQKMLSEGVIHADETPIRCLDKNHAKGSSLGYLWAYSTPNGDVLFDWQTSREHRHFTEWMGEDFEGVIISDGYKAYESFRCSQLARGKKVERAACMAHIRRKFVHAQDERPEVVGWILKMIGRLYAYESDWRKWELDDPTRVRLRRRHSRPLLKLLRRAFLHLKTTMILPKSNLGKALDYALGQWDAMQTYIEHGTVPIDNNAIERAIRPSAVGKKNWLFIGHPEAGQRIAILYSLLLSARNHGADPQAYLRDVLDRLPRLKASEIDELLPSNWAAAHQDSTDGHRPQVAVA